MILESVDNSSSEEKLQKQNLPKRTIDALDISIKSMENRFELKKKTGDCGIDLKEICKKGWNEFSKESSEAGKSHKANSQQSLSVDNSKLLYQNMNEICSN